MFPCLQQPQKAKYNSIQKHNKQKFSKIWGKNQAHCKKNATLFKD